MPEHLGRDERGGVTTVAEIRRVGDELMEQNFPSRRPRFEDLAFDTLYGIANGDAEDDPVALARAVCEVGGKVYDDDAAWVGWK